MLFNSLEFMIFFPIVCLAYYVIPRRVRYLFLLACSYFFYMCWNPTYALLLLTSTAATYGCGLLLGSFEEIADEKKRNLRKKTVLALTFLINLGILFFFKYFNFAASTLVRLLGLANIAVEQPVLDLVLPVGISFYTFQSLGYTMDVYRSDIKPERTFFKYALFVSFFPQIVSGPIGRAKSLLPQIDEKHSFSFEQVRGGLLLMLYGYFQKLVLTENLAIAVNSVFDTYDQRTGFQLLMASLLYAFQIYCDFASYSNLARGAAQVMGFRLMENFNVPYFSQSVAEFWRRWHISLSSWFRDYLYIPLGGNRKGKLRKHLNIMIVFLVSGLWHGASGHYVVWGFLNGIYQVIGEWMRPVKKWLVKVFRVDEEAFSHKLLRGIFTFALIDISWIFFRNPFIQSLKILFRIAGLNTDTYWFTWGNNLEAMGLTAQSRNLLVAALAVLLLVEICQYKKIRLTEWITRQGIWFRWLIYFAAIFGILIFGVYGPGYDASQFIYAQF